MSGFARTCRTNTPNPKRGGPKSFVELSWKWEVGPGVFFREVAGYFRVDNQAFRAQLTFWEGEAEEARYRAILQHVISSLSVATHRK